MNNMKQYLKALSEYESNNNRFGMLCQYMSQKNSTLIKQYLNGIANLPSFMLMKKLHNKYSLLCSQDEELNNLFLNAIECSKLFYIQTILLVKKTKDDGDGFETVFTRDAQPLGQKLINLLINIKFRIRIARAKRQANRTSQVNRTLGKLYMIPGTTKRWLNKLIYKTSILQSTYYSRIKKLYYIIIGIIILSFILLDSLFYKQFSTAIIVAMNGILCFILAAAAITMHPGGDFGKIDITGKNMIAYKYRAFFNNLSNKKLHNIFTMQHVYEPRHNASQTIESSECESIT